MERFETKDDLRGYLTKLYPDYGGQHSDLLTTLTDALWMEGEGFRTPNHLKHASYETLEAAGVPVLWIGDLLARVRGEGAAGALRDVQLEQLRQEVQRLSEALEMTILMRPVLESIVGKLLTYNEDAATRTTKPKFKEKLVKAYSRPELVDEQKRGLLKCMVCGEYLPGGVITASHIIKRFWATYNVHSTLFDIRNPDDVRNGLLMFKPFQWAFDNSFICFIFEATTDTFNMCILNPRIQDMKVLDVLRQPSTERLEKFAAFAQDKVVLEAIGDKTFRYFQNCRVQFHDTLTRPYKRALCFHANRARQYAVEQGWIMSDQLIFEDFWAEGAGYNQTVSRWLASQPQGEEQEEQAELLWDQ